jgi:hypothetical protein
VQNTTHGLTLMRFSRRGDHNLVSKGKETQNAEEIFNSGSLVEAE